VIVILDFGSQTCELIARRVRELEVYSEVLSYDIPAAIIKEKGAEGIILSGGPSSCYEEGSPLPDPEIFKLGIPILGICYGMQLSQQMLGGKGKVVELKGLMTSTPGQDRSAGFREALQGSEVEIAFEADMKWLEPDARKEMDSALSRLAKIDLVYAHNDPGAHGAYLAAKAAGREREMKFVGIDALPHEGVAYVEQGLLDATFQYPTGGKEAIETAAKILRGEKPPKTITLGSRMFSKDNVKQGGKAIE
jgi:ribose transport system substrate-binding protein